MIDAFYKQLAFELDDFQKEAIGMVGKGQSVVVCAPTGSGKTMIAEYAVFKAMAEGTKLFYTTPLKALSNQKYHDLKAAYGEENVGLLTGDMSTNRDANIVVMTTEIFRNMLYGIEDAGGILGEVDYVVLDECHFMNDAQRGTVWEESIIYCPESIQIIALSATVANAHELTDWINEVHHDTRLVISDFRPVPLRFFYYTREDLFPLFDGGTDKNGKPRLNKQLKNQRKGNRFTRNKRVFDPNDLLERMHEKGMLPSIVFTFSRKDCDKHAKQASKLGLLSMAEKAMLKMKIDQFIAQHPYLAGHQMLEWLENGFGSHHAGLLPGMKLLVESLFQQGLLKAVFATETLAAGINMPARSTVITALSKRTDDGHRLLNASEFLQMSGRAGRRGMDEVGYVVTVSTPWQGAQDAAYLASSPPDPLDSQFTPTYGMVLNLLQKYTLEQAQELIGKSFGQFTSDRRLKPLQQSISDKSEDLDYFRNFDCPDNLTQRDFEKYLKSQELYVEAGRHIRLMKKQLKQHGAHPSLFKEIEQNEKKQINLVETMEKTPCHECDLFKKHRRALERSEKLEKSLVHLKDRYEDEKDSYWQYFLNIHGLLKSLGHISDHDKPTESGELIAQIRAENELFIAQLILDGVLNDLQPPQLGAVVSAVANDMNKDRIFVDLRLSSEVKSALDPIYQTMKRLRRLQEKHHVAVDLMMNPIASPLVQAWAEGADWEYLTASTSLAEGDVVRHIRRCCDLLRQLSRIPQVPSELASSARQAASLLHRDPVKEVEMTDLPENP